MSRETDPSMDNAAAALATQWNLTQEQARRRWERETATPDPRLIHRPFRLIDEEIERFKPECGLNGNAHHSVDPEAALLREPDTKSRQPPAKSKARRTPREAAESYIDRGLHPIPIPYREKRPIIKDWPNLRLTKSDLPRYFNGAPSNIGVVLGDEYGTADVDLDCSEAIAAAQELLPETAMVFGRQSKPRSHYFYRSDPPVPTKRYLDPIEQDKDKACLVELRCQKSNGGVGLQTVVPPSLHKETGEQIRFERGCDADPATVDASVLQVAVARVAGAALLARHWPGEKSGRNEAFIALAGALVRAGWPLDDAIVFHRALYRVLWGLQADLEASKAEVVATYEKHKSGLGTTGRPKLETLVDKRAIQAALAWMDISRVGESHSPLAAAAEDWPKPEAMQDELPPVQAFSEVLLPDSFRPLVADVTERMQVPMDYAAAVMVLCLAGAVNRRAAIQPKANDTGWLVVPNLWGGIVAPPGLMKSPVIQAVTRPLNQIQTEWRLEHEEALRQYVLAKEECDLGRTAWKEQYKTALKNGRAVPPRPADEPHEPTLRRLIVNDATFEALHETMSENSAGILLVRDELTGLLSRLDQEQYGTERAFYLQAWNGDTGHTIDRIGRGTIHVGACCMSMLGGIQPARLRSYLVDALKDGPANDGLIQRFQVLVWPEPPAGWRYIDRKPNAAYEETASQVFRALAQLDSDNPLVFRFDREAQQLFIEWLTELELKLRGGQLHPALVSHLAKYRSLMPALGLHFELADRAAGGSVSFVGATPGEFQNFWVSLEHARQAAAWCDYLESHARRVYSCVATPQIRAARELASHIKQKHVINKDGGVDWFATRDVYRKGWAGLDAPEAVRRAAEVLQDAHWLRELPSESGADGGRPSNRWAVNPGIWQ